jgi:hypothetical protein
VTVPANPPQKISREDIEAKFVELATNLDSAAGSAKDVGKKVGIVAAVLLLILVFVLGRNRGSQSRTVVEIRRV